MRVVGAGTTVESTVVYIVDVGAVNVDTEIMVVEAKTHFELTENQLATILFKMKTCTYRKMLNST